jgi:hypothetical protein
MKHCRMPWVSNHAPLLAAAITVDGAPDRLDPGELLGVDVEQLARSRVLVAMRRSELLLEPPDPAQSARVRRQLGVTMKSHLGVLLSEAGSPLRCQPPLWDPHPGIAAATVALERLQEGLNFTVVGEYGDAALSRMQSRVAPSQPAATLVVSLAGARRERHFSVYVSATSPCTTP